MEKYSGLKANIHRHRSYRRLLEVDKQKAILELIFTILLFNSIIILFYPQITLWINQAAGLVLSPIFQNIRIITTKFFLGDVYLLEISGSYPGLNFSIFISLFALILIFLISRQDFVSHSISIWLIFALLIVLLSSLFFIFSARFFPYSMEAFLDLYIKTSICIWIIIPWIIMFSFIPLPINIGLKLIFVLMIILYAIIFSMFRYIVFIFILKSLSVLFMAPLYFILGPFLDFVYIVGFYAFVVSKIARRIDKLLPEWRWSY